MALDNLFFRQERVGRGGVPITVVKFRTMDGEMPEDDFTVRQRFVGQYVERDRVTKIGAVLRYFCLDEVPQLMNWIRGELRLVGLRPLLREEFNLLPDDVKEFYLAYGPGLIPADLPFISFSGNSDSRNAARRAAIDWLEILKLRDSVLAKVASVISVIFAAAKARLTDKDHLSCIYEKLF